jgi:Tfp pilus assembly protein PilZ
MNAQVFCRPVGRPLFTKRQATDVSLGGVRVYADEAPEVGDRLALELFLPDSSEAACVVEVVWIEPLPEGAPARFDVGVKYVEISAQARRQLEIALAPVED